MTSSRNGRTGERIALGVSAIIFLLIMLGIAIFVPEVTPFQVFVFRTVLAIVAAAAAAFIPGFIRLKLGLAANVSVRAGGALGVFVLIYAINPPLLISEPKKFIHEGVIGTLEKHISGKVTDFSLTLGDSRQDELRALYIDETIGDSWGQLLSRICDRYTACLKCAPSPGEIEDRVNIDLVGAPLRNHPDTDSGNVKICSGS